MAYTAQSPLSMRVRCYLQTLKVSTWRIWRQHNIGNYAKRNNKPIGANPNSSQLFETKCNFVSSKSMEKKKNIPLNFTECADSLKFSLWSTSLTASWRISLLRLPFKMQKPWSENSRIQVFPRIRWFFMVWRQRSFHSIMFKVVPFNYFITLSWRLQPLPPRM